MSIWDVFDGWDGGSCASGACDVKPPDEKRLVINLTNGGREAVDEFVHRFDAVVVNVDGDEHVFDPGAFVSALEGDTVATPTRHGCRTGTDGAGAFAAAWDEHEYAEQALLRLTETAEWCDLVDEVATSTHETAQGACDGMERALARYLEGLS